MIRTQMNADFQDAIKTKMFFGAHLRDLGPSKKESKDDS